MWDLPDVFPSPINGVSFKPVDSVYFIVSSLGFRPL